MSSSSRTSWIKMKLQLFLLGLEPEEIIDSWLKLSRVITKGLEAGGRPGASALLSTVLGFVIGGHIDDHELLRLSRVLSSESLEILEEKLK